MVPSDISYESLRAFCLSREVDLVLAEASEPRSICLHGEFDAYGDFFSIVATDVEYLDIAGGVTVGDLVLMPDRGMVSRIAPKWQHIPEVYSAQALAIRSADSESWDSANPMELFVIVAGGFSFRAGTDWAKAGGR